MLVVPVIVVLGTVVWLFTRPTRFPAPSSDATPDSAAGAETSLAQMRAPAVSPPTLDIPVQAPTLVPGLEEETGLSCPSLSEDLKTIVFVKLGTSGDDVFAACREGSQMPFEAPVRLACSTGFSEAFCSLSPNGTQLIFTVQGGGSSRLMLATSADRFANATAIAVSGTDPKTEHVDNPQWLDENTIRVVVGDRKFTRRKKLIAEKAGEGQFNVTRELQFQNPWPRMHLSGSRSRVYFPLESGIVLSGPKQQMEEFGMGHVLASADMTGEFDISLDDPIFVVPQEDLIFFTGRGPASNSSGSRLWMIRP